MAESTQEFEEEYEDTRTDDPIEPTPPMTIETPVDNPAVENE